MRVPVDLLGRWRITWMELWESDDLDLLAPAFITFDEDGGGKFTFIAVVGSLHGAYRICEGLPGMDFTWAGADECDPASGDGWAAIQPDGTLAGHIRFQAGDESDFLARKW